MPTRHQPENLSDGLTDDHYGPFYLAYTMDLTRTSASAKLTMSDRVICVSFSGAQATIFDTDMAHYV